MKMASKPKEKNMPVRQRKSHRKSRLGCGNCKLRSVKVSPCHPPSHPATHPPPPTPTHLPSNNLTNPISYPQCDETKPACTRCRTSGFTCNYTASTPSLQLATSGVLKFDVNLNFGIPPPAPRFRIPVAVPLAGRTGEYEMRERDYAVLDRFKRRTVLTMGTGGTRWVYTESAFDLGKTVCLSYPSHLISSCSSTYDH